LAIAIAEIMTGLQEAALWPCPRPPFPLGPDTR